MGQEIAVALWGCILCILWLFVDRRIYKWLGMSPLFGSLEQEDPQAVVDVFAVGISWYIAIFSILAFIYMKIRGNITDGFSYMTWLGVLLAFAIVGNIVTRPIVRYYLRKRNKETGAQ